MDGLFAKSINDVDHGYLNILRNKDLQKVKDNIQIYIEEEKKYEYVQYAKAIYYYLEKDKKRAAKFFSRTLSSNKINDLHERGKIFLYMTKCYSDLNESYLQKKYFNLAEEIFIEEKSYYYLIQLYLSTMYTEALKRRENYYIKKYLKKTREMITLLKDEDVFNIYVCLGEVYIYIKDYESAKNMFKEAMKYAKLNNKYDEIAFTVCFLKDIYVIDNRLSDAREIIIETIETYEKKLNIMTKLSLAIEIFEIYINEKKINKDIEVLLAYINKILKKLDKRKQQQFKVKVNILICRKIMLEIEEDVSKRENLSIVKGLIRESEETYIKYKKNFKFSDIYYWIIIIKGDISFSEGDYLKALEYYNDALRSSYKFNIRYTLRCYNGIKLAYKNNGDYEKALIIAKRINSILKDINIENEKKVTKINARYNELKSYDKIKEKFFSKLSYDLKEPINSIYSCIQLIDNMSNIGSCELKEYYLKYNSVVTKNCLKVLKTINNLIDAVKIDADELKVEFKNYNIVYLVEDIVSKTVKYASLQNNDLIFDTEIEELIIKCDPNLIEKIILSIISNTLMVSVENSDIFISISETKSYVKIKFKYNGNDVDNCIFNSLRNNINSYSFKFYAKNLSIAKSLLELHNGKVYVNNKYSHGNELTILLPKLMFQDLNKNMTIENYQINDLNVAIEFCDLIL